VWLLDTMGQRPFYPPNVGGWDQDLAWLSTATIRARFNAASTVMHDLVAEGSVPASRTPEQAVAEALRASGSPWVSRTTQAGLLQYARRSVAGRTQAWQVKHYFPERQRVLLHLLLAGPDAQVS
jgi:uncharacterized protein (DUF1800 family)